MLIGERFDLAKAPSYDELFDIVSITGRPFMAFGRRALVLTVIVAAFGSATLVAQGGDAGKGRGGGGMTEAQKRAVIQPFTSAADDAATGRPVPNDLSLAWIHSDVLRMTEEGQTFVPFILTLDPAKVTGNTLSVYWRVVSKSSAPPPPPAANAKKNDKNPPPAPSYAYEDLTPATVTPGQPVRISRSFTTTAGSYDVYVVVREGLPPSATDKKPDKNAPLPKVAVIKQTIDVPDLWNGELNTSSVILAESFNPLPTPLSALDRVSRPYALGAVELVPYTRTKFVKKEEIDAFILIYNTKTDPAGKSDVKVEFNFLVKQAGGEKFFNRTVPTNLNGVASIQLQAAQGVPLRDFPEGDYRLEIIVTDNVAKKEVKRDVNFSVTGP